MGISHCWLCFIEIVWEEAVQFVPLKCSIDSSSFTCDVMKSRMAINHSTSNRITPVNVGWMPKEE